MDAAEPFNIPVNPVALGIPVSTVSLCISLLHYGGLPCGFHIYFFSISSHEKGNMRKRRADNVKL